MSITYKQPPNIVLPVILYKKDFYKIIDICKNTFKSSGKPYSVNIIFTGEESYEIQVNSFDEFYENVENRDKISSFCMELFQESKPNSKSNSSVVSYKKLSLCVNYNMYGAGLTLSSDDINWVKAVEIDIKSILSKNIHYKNKIAVIPKIFAIPFWFVITYILLNLVTSFLPNLPEIINNTILFPAKLVLTITVAMFVYVDYLMPIYTKQYLSKIILTQNEKKPLRKQIWIWIVNQIITFIVGLLAGIIATIVFEKYIRQILLK